MNKFLITPATSLPVDHNDVKKQLRIDIGDHDEEDLLTRYIRIATAWAENYTGLAFLEQTWEIEFEEFPEKRYIKLYPSPVLNAETILDNIVSITYEDADGETQSLDKTNFVVRQRYKPNRLQLKPGNYWPESGSNLVVRYKAGYESVDKIPEQAIGAILLYVGHLDQNREDTKWIEYKTAAMRLLNQIRIWEFM